MNEPLIEHAPPPAFPVVHYTGCAVPADFARAVAAAALKAGVLFEDQLLTWAQAGAECSRLHKAQQPGRSKKR